MNSPAARTVHAPVAERRRHAFDAITEARDLVARCALDVDADDAATVYLAAAADAIDDAHEAMAAALATTK